MVVSERLQQPLLHEDAGRPTLDVNPPGDHVSAIDLRARKRRPLRQRRVPLRTPRKASRNFWYQVRGRMLCLGEGI